MLNNYKPSMFNHFVEDRENNSLILFNSYVGRSNIVNVQQTKKEKVKQWLRQDEIAKDVAEKDDDFCRLIELGYFVHTNTDEKAKRDVMINRLKADNTLKLVIHTSKSCNFRCKYCYLYFDKDGKHHNISKDTQEGIINFVKKNINNYRAVHVDWFGGEPLLDISAIEYISKELMHICKMAKRPYEAVITTNGYLLSERNIKTLLDCKVRHIAVTIDGLKRNHDSLRVLANGNATFDKIISNLVYIRDEVKTRVLSISIRSNLAVNAIDSIEEYYDYYDGMFGNDSRFSLFIRPIKDMGGEQIDQIDNLLFQNSDMDFGMIYERLSRIQGKIKFDPNFIDMNIGGMRCYANNFNRFSIGVDGLIAKCDESIDEIGIGSIDKYGSMHIDENLHSEWMKPVQANSNCDECFYSCCCGMDPCPKSRVKNGYTDCPASIKEIDSLLRFYVRTYEVQDL